MQIWDRSAYVPQSLRQWLEAELFPCTILEATDVAQAIASASLQLPGVILVDLDTRSAHELDILLRLSQFCPCAVVGIGLDDTPAHRYRAQQAGVTMFIPKAQLQTDLPHYLRAVLQARTKSECIAPLPGP